MKKLLTAAALAATCALPVEADTLTDTFTSFYAFGDSLSDDGKLNRPLPYFEGQFSSGPVWSEIIGKRFTDAGSEYGNLALGGATAGDVNENSNGDPADGEYPAAAQPFATFNSQIDVFTSLAATAVTGDNPLISVLFGANDIFQGGNPISAANAVADGIERLVALGPKFNDYLVATLPELGDPPSAALGDLTIAGKFNMVLGSRLTSIEGAGINIIDVNQNEFQFQLASMLPDLGVTNLEGPCLIAPTLTTEGADCTIIGFDLNGPIRDLSIADTYYLIDSVHPSGPIQQAFGEFALAAIDDSLLAPVPLPAALPLMLAGLAGLGALGLRRRRRTTA